jgi:hypothetical protein
MKIKDIYEVTFPAALAQMQDGRPWASELLNAWTNEGRIVIRHLDDEDEVESIVVPTTWTLSDEAHNPNENQKIALAASLIKNTVYALEDMLEGIVKQHPHSRIVVSSDTRYYRFPVTSLPGQAAWYSLTCIVYTKESLDE